MNSKTFLVLGGLLLILLVAACSSAEPEPKLEVYEKDLSYTPVPITEATPPAPEATPAPKNTPVRRATKEPKEDKRVSIPVPTATPIPLPTATVSEKKIVRIMSEWIPMTVEINRITLEEPDDPNLPEGTMLEYVLYRIKNPNDEVGFISFYIVGFDESGYKLSNDIMGAQDLAGGYHFRIATHVSPKSESIGYTEFKYWEERKSPYVWDVALKESNSGWEKQIEELDYLYAERLENPESGRNIDFLPMKPSDYNILMVQVDGGVISGGVPWTISDNLSVGIFYQHDRDPMAIEVIDVDPSNNDYFSIDGPFLYNNTDSRISAQFACDVTKSYPESVPKFPDVENLRYAYTRVIRVESTTRTDRHSTEFKASLAPVVEEVAGTEQTTICHSWSIILNSN